MACVCHVAGGKMHGRPFKGHNERETSAYATIYADLWGPVTTSVQGHKYAILLVDDATSYVWVNFMSYKSQAAEMIKSFILQQERRNN